MSHDLILTIIGYAAAVCMVCGYLPQAIYTIRTRDTDGIALPTFLLLGAGSILFVAQGLMLDNWPLVITNAITTVSSLIVFGIKMHNDYGSGKKRPK
ncbi:MAG: PQ-loop domain-containing transporter [Bacteroides sp.]|nr:PQ-loop domain-containing transporter [Bacteroides sp.]MCM1413006.1 PQ-loop domain-containing transporter [Bacteroides sp.]MCM1471712.1 PQ-loop domain-containing transporter [Bacteroides sp.]